MIKRIDPQSSLKIPLRNIQHKNLHPMELTDPTLSTPELISLQQQLQANDRVKATLATVLKQIDQSYVNDINSIDIEEDLDIPQTIATKTRSDVLSQIKSKHK